MFCVGLEGECGVAEWVDPLLYHVFCFSTMNFGISWHVFCYQPVRLSLTCLGFYVDVAGTAAAVPGEEQSIVGKDERMNMINHCCAVLARCVESHAATSIHERIERSEFYVWRHPPHAHVVGVNCCLLWQGCGHRIDGIDCFRRSDGRRGGRGRRAFGELPRD